MINRNYIRALVSAGLIATGLVFEATAIAQVSTGAINIRVRVVSNCTVPLADKRSLVECSNHTPVQEIRTEKQRTDVQTAYAKDAEKVVVF